MMEIRPKRLGIFPCALTIITATFIVILAHWPEPKKSQPETPKNASAENENMQKHTNDPASKQALVQHFRELIIRLAKNESLQDAKAALQWHLAQHFKDEEERMKKLSFNPVMELQKEWNRNRNRDQGPVHATRPWSSKTLTDKINQMFRDVWYNPHGKRHYRHTGTDISSSRTPPEFTNQRSK